MSAARRTRLTRRNVAAVLVSVLVLLLAGALEGLFQRGFGEEAWGARFENVDVGLGEAVDVDGVRASVLSVESAYQFTELSDERVANGIFVILRLRGEFERPGANDMAEISAHYAGVNNELAGGRTPQVDTGFWEERTIVFDVDPDHLAGLRVTIAQKEVTFRYRTRAVVDLGINPARAAELRAVSPDLSASLPSETMGALP